MSELFDEDPRDAPAERPPSRRSRALVITAVVLVLAFFGLTTFANFYTNVLWYRDVGFGSVYSRLLWTKIGLFAVFGLLMAVVVAVNMVVAFRLRPLFHPQSPEQTGLDRYRQAVTPIRTWLVLGLAVLLGIFAGTSGAGEWRTYLLWRNGVPFEREDAYFGKDIGFFVFDLPWYHFLVDFVMAVTVVALLAAAVVHYLYGGIRLQTPGDRLSGAAQAQLSVLLGVFVLAKAADYWLDRYDLAYQSGSLLTGITYTDDNAVLPAKAILMGIALICAVLFFLNVWRRTWLLPSMGLALLVLSAILLGLIWPGIVQQFQVRPSEADKESPYISKNIEATRAAYDIDSVEEYKLPAGTARPTVLDDATATSVKARCRWSTRSWCTCTFEQNQQVRGYYSVADVLDVDHYEINGVDRALVLGARELDQSALDGDVQNWLNLHTVYTHGNDVIAAYANQRDDQDAPPRRQRHQRRRQDPVGAGQPVRPGRPRAGRRRLRDPRLLRREQPRLLRGRQGRTPSDDERRARAPRPRTRQAPSTTTYDGKGGVPVGSTFRQLLYAIKFGSTNFLLSGRVNANSEVIYNRDPAERVQKVAPWLTLDDDVYPTIVDERIVWVVDGYTTTDRFPGSERESFKTMTDDSLQDESGLRTLPTDEINYMRNSVKATVDAYDGTVTLYAWDDQDPLLKAWSSAFPGTVKSEGGHPRGAPRAPALPRGHVQGAALPVRALPRDRPQRLVPGRPALERAGGPQRLQQPAAALPDVRDPAAGPGPRRRERAAARGGAARRVGVVDDVDVRAVQAEQPRGVRLGRLRRHLADLRPDAGHRRARPAAAGPRPGRQRRAVEQRGRGQAVAVQAERQLDHLRQPAHRPGGRRADVRRADLRLARPRRRPPPSRSCATCWSPTAARSASAPRSRRRSTSRARVPTTPPTNRRTTRPTTPRTTRPTTRRTRRTTPRPAPSTSRSVSCSTRPRRSSSWPTRPTPTVTWASTRTTSRRRSGWWSRRSRCRTARAPTAPPTPSGTSPSASATP